MLLWCSGSCFITWKIIAHQLAPVKDLLLLWTPADCEVQKPVASWHSSTEVPKSWMPKYMNKLPLFHNLFAILIVMISSHYNQPCCTVLIHFPLFSCFYNLASKWHVIWCKAIFIFNGQAEAVSELLQARTSGAADSALAGLSGGVGAAVGSLRAQARSC